MFASRTRSVRRDLTEVLAYRGLFPSLPAAHYLDHLIPLGLRISAGHGQDADLLSLGAAVRQRQRHLPVSGTVCGMRPAQEQHTQSCFYGEGTRQRDSTCLVNGHTFYRAHRTGRVLEQ